MTERGQPHAGESASRRLERLEEVAAALVIDISPDGVINYASASHQRILGYAPEEIVGKDHRAVAEMLAISDPTDLPLSKATLAELAQRGELKPVRRARRRDGGVCWIQCDVTTYQGADGQHTLSISTELAGRVEQESARLETEAKLRSVQRIASVGSWEWYPGSGRFEASEESRRILGAGEEARDHRQVLERVAPEDRERYQRAIDRAVFGGSLDVEVAYRQPGGEVQVIRTRGEWDASGSGEPRIIGTVHDVTGLRRAESAARQSQRRLRQILISLPTTQIIVWNRDCTARNIYGGTSDKTYGLSGRRVKGAVAGEFLPEERRATGFENVRSVFETGETRRVREEVIMPAGTFVFDVSISPLRDDAGEIQNVLTVCHDVTDRVREEEEQARLETRVQEAQKLESLGLLAGGVAHDFNNLLVGILGNADLALHRLEPGTPLHRLLEAIETSSQHASDLTDQLLAFAGKGSLEMGPVDLASVVRDTTGLLNASVRGAAQLRVEAEEEASWVDADAVQIRQIAMNLVSNASEASESGGQVIVRTGSFLAGSEYLDECLVGDDLQPGRYAFLEVEDSGSGIADEDRAQIFDPFYTTKFKGRGLGLSAVMGIVRAHHGAMHLDSAPDEGTVFRTLFPPTKAPAAAAAAPAEAAGEWKSGGRILVVDDSETVREVAASALESIGFSSIVASSGFEAVEILREAKHGLVAVLLDLTMPGMDGLQTFRALRALNGELPVLFMSGYSEELVTEQLGGERGIASLHKPFTIGSLSDHLRSLLGD